MKLCRYTIERDVTTLKNEYSYHSKMDLSIIKNKKENGKEK